MKYFLLVCIMILLVGTVATLATATTFLEVIVLGVICGVLGWVFGNIAGGM